MLQINLEGLDIVEDTVSTMIHDLKRFGHTVLGDELSDWQTQDMHRKKPFTMRWKMGKAQTVSTSTLRPLALAAPP